MIEGQAGPPNPLDEPEFDERTEKTDGLVTPEDGHVQKSFNLCIEERENQMGQGL